MKKKEEEAQEVKKKTWLVVLTSIFLVLIVVGVLLCFYRDKVLGCNGFFGKGCEVILDGSEIRIHEKLTLHSGENFDIKDFFIEDIELVDVKANFVNRDETVTDKDLIVSETNVILSVGTFDVTIQVGEKSYTSVLEVLDRTEPIFEVKDVEVVEGEEVTKDSFVVSCEDNSKVKCILSILDSMGQEAELNMSVGTRKYMLVARDEAGNETKKEVTLTITKKENDNTENNSSANKIGSTSSNSDNSTSSSGKKVISTKNETEESYEEAKYGTRYKITKIIKVTTYSDGTKMSQTTKTTKVLDTSGYNAKTNDLKTEATAQKSKESTNINQILTATNQYRAEVGLKPLILDDKLTVAANVRAMEMAWGNEKSHTRPDGTSCFTIIDEFFPGVMTRSGENIAYGQANGTSAAKWWRNSPGHYRNMTDLGFTHIGIGVYKLNGMYYYVQLFTLFTN